MIFMGTKRGFNEFGVPFVVTEMIGLRYGRLIVLKYCETYFSGGKKKHKVLCICDCGNKALVDVNNVRNLHTTSCGCYGREQVVKANTKYGKGKKEYNRWLAMVGRCHDPKRKKYENYGGRGIFVCDGWRYDFLKFNEDMGSGGDLTIERIDNDGGYTCGKCEHCIKNGYSLSVKWATREEQERNKRRTRFFEYNGECMIADDWAEKFNFPSPRALYQRLKRGIDMMKAVSTPLNKYKKNAITELRN